MLRCALARQYAHLGAAYDGAVIRPETADVIDAWSCAELGVSPGALHAGMTIVEHAAAFRDYRGVYALRSGGACVISAPAGHVDAIRAALAGQSPECAFDAGVIATALGEEAGAVIGPAWIGYTCAQAGAGDEARILTPADGAALVRLLDACPPAEREHSGITPDSAPVFGVFDGMEIIAAASWKERGPHIRQAGVLAHQAHRGRGRARAAAAALTDAGVASGLVMQWQTLYANAPSLAIGRALGYEQRFETIAVRLR